MFNIKIKIIFLWIVLQGALIQCTFWTPEVKAAPWKEVPKVVKCPKPYIKNIKPLTALVGAKIVVRGNRFGNDVGLVIFTDNVSGEIVSWKNKRIETIVPKGAITGNVVVVRPCSSKSNTQFFSIKLKTLE